MSGEPIGCLGLFLKMFGVGSSTGEEPATTTEFPYRLRDDFLSPAEFSFYKVLHAAVGDSFVICPKVSLSDLFYVSRPHENKGAKNRINRKHVDFVLCEPTTMNPVCAVELDDKSHNAKRRIERDEFVDQVFHAAGLAIVHVKAERAYTVDRIRTAVAEAAKCTTKKPELPSTSRYGIPTCPKCEIELVKRTATKGSRKGIEFWGCSNYPKCRHTQEVG